MPGLINRVIEDHRHVLRLLNCLDNEIDRFRESADSTLKTGIIHDAVDYLYHYCDVFFDAIKVRLASKLRMQLSDSKSRSVFERLEQEHKQLCELSGRLLALLGQVGVEYDMSTNRLISTFQEYSHLRKQHIKTESEYFIPLLNSYISTQERLSVEQQMKKNPDPLFGAHTWLSYESLYDYIVQQEQGVVQ